MCQEKNYNYSWYRIKGPQNYDGFIQKIVVWGQSEKSSVPMKPSSGN